MPPPSRDSSDPAPTSRGSRYFSCASSTCSLPSRVRARRAKMSRISCVRSTTLHVDRRFCSSRSCAGDSSLSKITTSTSASAAAFFSRSTLPLPRNVAESGLARSCSTRSTTCAPAASASPASSSSECSASMRRVVPVTRPTRAARSWELEAGGLGRVRDDPAPVERSTGRRSGRRSGMQATQF